MIFFITNRALCSDIDFKKRVREASLAGVDYILIREKGLSDDELGLLAVEVKQLCMTKTKVIIGHSERVYDRLEDVYLHNGFKGQTKNSFSVATHSLKEVEAVQKTNASFVFVSHIFETDCKKNMKAKGIEFLNECLKISQESKLEVVALGGINRETINVLRETEVKHIAIMSEWHKCEDVKLLLQHYRKLGY